jgi:hypothetical protein
MTEGVTTIGLFGCNYGADTEHSTQRGSLEYWLGRFEQAGGTVVLPVKASSLLNFPPELYGYESHDDKGRLIGGYADGFALKKRHLEKADGARVTLTMLAPDAAVAVSDLAPLPPGETDDVLARRAAQFAPEPKAPPKATKKAKDVRLSNTGVWGVG